MRIYRTLAGGLADGCPILESRHLEPKTGALRGQRFSVIGTDHGRHAKAAHLPSSKDLQHFGI